MTMNYYQDFQELKSAVNYSDDCIECDDLTIRNYSFESAAFGVLNGHSRYSCETHGLTFPGQVTGSVSVSHDLVDNTDSDVGENHRFRYHIFFPPGTEKSKSLILFFHGFNEKNWDKYYPWAKRLALQTGKAVVMFPFAFHINRAPAQWSDKRAMFGLSRKREQAFPNIMKSSLSNVAISIRLHTHPDRFIWAGLESYYDIITFIGSCRAGLIPEIDRECTFDFFSYSIGCLLAEILMLTNYKGVFTDSRLCMFCGGAVFNRLSPVSKYILDSEANVALYSFLVEHLDIHMKHNPRLSHFLSKEHMEGYNLSAMLDYKVNREYREQMFRSLQNQIYALTLKQDKVVPAYEVVNTLQGIYRDIAIPVEVMDFAYPYTHENPFPSADAVKEEVETAFTAAFDKISAFLK